MLGSFLIWGLGGGASMDSPGELDSFRDDIAGVSILLSWSRWSLQDEGGVLFPACLFRLSARRAFPLLVSPLSSTGG